MKKHITALLFAMLLMLAGAHAYAAVGDYVVVLKHPQANLLETEDGGSSSSRIFLADSYMDALNFAPADEIECIFPDGIAYLLDDAEELIAPVNDPRYFDQWHLQHINAAYAWGRGYNGKGVKVGIVDSGMKKPSHEDIPVPNSFFNILSGSDYTDYSDNYGHGTKVAGIIGATANNSVGIAGVSYGAELIPIKVTDGKTLSTGAILEGIDKAAESGCSVINVSAGFTASTSSQSTVYSIGTAVSKLVEKYNLIIVAAAGNAGKSEYQYPASYDCVVSVASCGRALRSDDAGKGYTEGTIMDLKPDGSGYNYRYFLPDEPSTFTQHNDQVNVSAPGYQIFSTTYTGGYTRSDGTSFASPIVAGAAAIAKQIDPDITAEEFIDALAITSKDVYTDGYDEYTGHGILDIKALTDYLAGAAADPTEAPDVTDAPTGTPDVTDEPKITEEPTDAPDATSKPTKEPEITPEPTDEPVSSVEYNGKYTVKAVIPPAPPKAKVYIAFYKGGRLAAIRSTAVVEGSTSTNIVYPSFWSSGIADEIEKIDIFSWDSDMRPFAEKQTIPRADWQTE